MRRQHVLSSAAHGFIAKLAPKFAGPYRVLRKLSAVVVELANDRGQSVGKSHISHLKPYLPPFPQDNRRGPSRGGDTETASPDEPAARCRVGLLREGGAVPSTSCGGEAACPGGDRRRESERAEEAVTRTTDPRTRRERRRSAGQRWEPPERAPGSDGCGPRNGPSGRTSREGERREPPRDLESEPRGRGAVERRSKKQLAAAPARQTPAANDMPPNPGGYGGRRRRTGPRSVAGPHPARETEDRATAATEVPRPRPPGVGIASGSHIIIVSALSRFAFSAAAAVSPANGRTTAPTAAERREGGDSKGDPGTEAIWRRPKRRRQNGRSSRTTVTNQGHQYYRGFCGTGGFLPARRIKEGGGRRSTPPITRHFFPPLSIAESGSVWTDASRGDQLAKVRGYSGDLASAKENAA